MKTKNNFNQPKKVSNAKMFLLIFFVTATSHFAYSCSANFSSIITGCNVSFTSSATGVAPFSYSWDFGDGNTSTLSNPSNTYSHDGPFEVKLTVTDSLGCISTSKHYVLVTGCFPAGYGYFTYTANLCTIQFNDSSVAGGGANYHWDFGDGDTSNLINPAHTYTSSGLYYVCLDIIDHANICSYEFCDSLYIECQKPNGINDNGIYAKLLVFPNPSNEIFYLQNNSDNLKIKQILLYSNLGEILKASVSVEGQNFVINLANFPSGVYHCTMQNSNGQIATIKLIKK
jgi:hypothetical protein